jgi:hypothetical protein
VDTIAGDEKLSVDTVASKRKLFKISTELLLKMPQ